MMAHFPLHHASRLDSWCFDSVCVYGMVDLYADPTHHMVHKFNDTLTFNNINTLDLDLYPGRKVGA